MRYHVEYDEHGELVTVSITVRHRLIRVDRAGRVLLSGMSERSGDVVLRIGNDGLTFPEAAPLESRPDQAT